MFFLLLTSMIICFFYAIISLYRRGIVNGLIFIFAKTILFSFVLYAFYLFRGSSDPGVPYPWDSYLFMLLSYTIYFFGLSFGYIVSPNKIMAKKNIKIKYSQKKVVIFLLIIFFLIICNMLIITHKTDAIPFSRNFYEKTRIGFGIYYFQITALSTISILISLIAIKNKFKIIPIFMNQG